MNEKLNTVFDIINATNTVSANRYLSHALGAEVAIIYNALLAKYAYYSNCLLYTSPSPRDTR